MTALGRVRDWHADGGWGVIDSEATPGGCWAHFSDLNMTGHRTLNAGEAVTFDFEVCDQDGYQFRAVGVWPDSQPRTANQPPSHGRTDAYQSTLVLDDLPEGDDGGPGT
jgi:CspA family cold shock protein